MDLIQSISSYLKVPNSWKILDVAAIPKGIAAMAYIAATLQQSLVMGNVSATLQLQLYCRSIGAIPCCRNIAAMQPLLQYHVRIAAIRNASTHCRNIAAMPNWHCRVLETEHTPSPRTAPITKLWTESVERGELKGQIQRQGGNGRKEQTIGMGPWELVLVREQGSFGLGFSLADLVWLFPAGTLSVL